MFFVLVPSCKRLSLTLMLCTMAFLGCVRVDADRQEPVSTRLVVTRDTKGVNMQFQSVKGLHYTIFYRDTEVPNNTWIPLPNAIELKGTGELILLSDTSPRAFQRKYRIQTLVPLKTK